MNRVTRPMRPILTTVILAVVVICDLWIRPAQAYVDPGSGGLLWQGILAALFGIGFFWRETIAKVRHLWRKPPDDRG